MSDKNAHPTSEEEGEVGAGRGGACVRAGSPHLEARLIPHPCPPPFITHSAPLLSTPQFASETGSEYEEEGEEEARTGDSQPSTQAPSPSGRQAPDRLPGGELSVPPEIKDLFQYIAKYAHVEIDMEPELKPFIPELIPAIGDIDAFIKVGAG